MIFRSYAKLNLYLLVLDRRRDNYHNLVTIFERISLYDKITLTLRPDNKIKVLSDSPHIPKDNANLAWRSARLLQKAFNLKKGVDITIDKRIPVGSGMGGGSSNAATVLLGLNKIWGLKLTLRRLAGLAQRIGSDVPFFIYNCPFAQGTSRGERLEPLGALGKIKFWHILVVPGIKVSTPLIYKNWDKQEKVSISSLPSGQLKIDERVRLTNHKDDVKILTSVLKRKEFSLISGLLFNSLEQTTFKLYPQVKRIKERLSRFGLESVLMSGSGPTLFGIVASKKEALSFKRKLSAKNNSWRVFVAHTV